MIQQEIIFKIIEVWFNTLRHCAHTHGTFWKNIIWPRRIWKWNRQ